LLCRFHFHVVEKFLADIDRVDSSTRPHRTSHRQAEDAAAGTDVGDRLPRLDLQRRNHFRHFQACNPRRRIEGFDPFLCRQARELSGGRLRDRKCRNQ
jgi:hypothetical protein